MTPPFRIVKSTLGFGTGYIPLAENHLLYNMNLALYFVEQSLRIKNTHSILLALVIVTVEKSYEPS